MTTPSLIRFGSPEVPRVIKDDADNIVEGNPEQGSWVYTNDAKAGSRSGFWECSAGKFRAKMNGFTEFCHILEGEAHITNLADGTVNTVKAGDTFVMEAGYETEWHVPHYIRKCFVVTDVK